MTRRFVSLAFATLALLAACAQPDPPAGDGRALSAEAVDRPAAGWEAFPVDRVPRPIVVLPDGLVEVKGFHTGDGKVAFLTGGIELAAPLPETPATVAVDLPEGRFTFPALGSDEAFASVRAYGSPNNVVSGTPAPLRITRVTLGSAEFRTDRGLLRLPAWLFGGPDIMGAVAWPAVGREAFWRYGEWNDAMPVPPDRLSRDGRRIRYAVPGQPDCPGLPVLRYRVEVVETATTVELTTHSEVVSTPGPEDKGRACPAVLPGAVPYDVDLAAPLGNRVVVSRDSNAPR